MAKFEFLLAVMLIISTTIFAEPIISYENDQKISYTNMQNNWWEQSSSSFRNQIPGHVGDQNVKILNSYLASNVNNLELGDVTYARVQETPSWQFDNSKVRPSALNNSTANNNISKRKRHSGSDDFVSSTSDGGAGMAAGGYYVGTLFRDPGDDDSSSYFYYYTIPGNNPPPDTITPDVPVAPAPASILLGTIGIAIVGFLKNIKSKILA